MQENSGRQIRREIKGGQLGERVGKKVGEKVGEKTGEKVGESLGEIDKVKPLPMALLLLLLFCAYILSELLLYSKYDRSSMPRVGYSDGFETYSESNS